MRKDIHNQIIDAKVAHRKWVGYAHLLVEGADISKEMLPLVETECGFGKWYFSDGQVYYQSPLFKQIGRQHELLHAKYAEIVAILFKEKSPSFFQRLIGAKVSIDQSDRNLARAKYEELNEISHIMLRLLDKFMHSLDKKVSRQPSMQ